MDRLSKNCVSLYELIEKYNVGHLTNQIINKKGILGGKSELRYIFHKEFGHRYRNYERDNFTPEIMNDIKIAMFMPVGSGIEPRCRGYYYIQGSASDEDWEEFEKDIEKYART